MYAIRSYYAPGVIDENITLYGGFKKGSWQNKTGRTYINIESAFPEDNPAFYIYGGNLTVENINFSISKETSDEGRMVSFQPASLPRADSCRQHA